MLIPIFENGEVLEFVNPEEFVCEPMYYKLGYATTPGIKLRTGVLQRLRMAQIILKKIGGYQLKIFDGFRPIAIQEIIYNKTYQKFKNEHPSLDDVAIKELTHRYVAFPDKNLLSPPPHNTGGAVDLTIVDGTGEEIPMGTSVDDVTIKVYTDYFIHSGKEEKDANRYHTNRMLLKKVMESAGFKNYPEEWWHFNYGNQEWVELGGGEIAIYGSAEE